MSRFLDALRFLTIFPVQRWRTPSPEQMGKAMVCFPFVGTVLGLILATVAWGLRPLFPPWVLAAILVGLLIVMTGGLHWDGVADTFDGLGGARGDRQRMLTIMKDSRIGGMGVLSLAFLVVFKVILLAQLPGTRWADILIFMPMAGRLVQLEMAAWGRYARAETGTGQAFVEGTRRSDFWFALGGVALLSLWVLGWSGLGLLLLCLLYGIGIVAFFHRKLGGVTGDILGMASETTEILALILAYLIHP